jgi:hypothetical protein
MHYLTQYYKNLSEQLQEKVNFLEAQLKEGRFVNDPATRKGKNITVIGKVPMLGDTDAINVMPEPDRYESHTTELRQKETIRPENKILKNKPAAREKKDIAPSPFTPRKKDPRQIG